MARASNNTASEFLELLHQRASDEPDRAASSPSDRTGRTLVATGRDRDEGADDRTGSNDHPSGDGSDEGDVEQMLLARFAELVLACRSANLDEARELIDAIDRLAGDMPELSDLARSLLAEVTGELRQAERHLTDCLRRPHHAENLTRPVALIERATHRMRLGLLDASLADLVEAERYGRTLLSLHGVAIKALIHWWRGDQGQALDALEQGPRLLIQGTDLGVGWYALAAEVVKNGQVFSEDLRTTSDCLAREFWEARPDRVAPSYVGTLGPHIIRHELASGRDATPLLTELDTGASPESATGRAFEWCQALVDGDSDRLAEIADRQRDDGLILDAIQAYRDAAGCAPTTDGRERLLRRSRFMYDRLSRAVKVKEEPELPPSLARELTAAEQNVVAAVAQGLSNREAAELLSCSVRTIESHLTSTYRKLGIKRRTQLAVLIAQARMEP